MRLFEYENFILEEILTELQKTKQELLDMVARLKKIIVQSDYEGERENAKSLLKKVLFQLENEYGWKSHSGAKTQEPPKRDHTNKAKSQAGAKAYQKADDLAFKVVFFGRFFDPNAGKKGSDKVWGWGVKGDYIYQFWGPTGKTPQVKRMDNTPYNRNLANRKAAEKVGKGYQKMSAAESEEWIKQVLQRSPKFS